MRINYPRTLQPTTTEQVTLLSGEVVHLSKAVPMFTRWSGTPLNDTYGKKPIIDANGEPVFAELAILRLFQAEGWEGVWVDTYRRRQRIAIDADTSLPEDKEVLLNHIYHRAGTKAGCFDVYCWKDRTIVFAESKWKARDQLQPSQIRWLTAAVATGLPIEAFLLVEWSVQEAR